MGEHILKKSTDFMVVPVYHLEEPHRERSGFMLCYNNTESDLESDLESTWH